MIDSAEATSTLEGEHGETIPEPPGAVTEPQSANVVKEFLDRSQHTFEDWQKKVDERIRAAVESLNPMAALEKEVRSLAARLAELEKRLDE